MLRFTEKGWAQGGLWSSISIWVPCSSHTLCKNHCTWVKLCFFSSALCLFCSAADPSMQWPALPACSAKARSCRHHRAVSKKEDEPKDLSKGYTVMWAHTRTMWEFSDVPNCWAAACAEGGHSSINNTGQHAEIGSSVLGDVPPQALLHQCHQLLAPDRQIPSPPSVLQ